MEQAMNSYYVRIDDREHRLMPDIALLNQAVASTDHLERDGIRNISGGNHYADRIAGFTVFSPPVLVPVSPRSGQRLQQFSRSRVRTRRRNRIRRNSLPINCFYCFINVCRSAADQALSFEHVRMSAGTCCQSPQSSSCSFCCSGSRT